MPYLILAASNTRIGDVVEPMMALWTLDLMSLKQGVYLDSLWMFRDSRGATAHHELDWLGRGDLMER